MRYWAYLSYAHADERQARRLHRRIESFGVPSSLRGTRIAGLTVGARLRPLFRDRDELSSSGDLKSSLEEALSASTALIVLCSPAAAASRWVNTEIECFVAEHGPRRVFPLILAGEPNSGDERECFPPALRGAVAGLEPIAGDLRRHADGRRDGTLKVIAGLLQVGFDVVKRRDAQRRQRTALGLAAAASIVAAVTTVMAVYAIEQRDIAELRRAQAEDLIGFMLGDLHDRLREVGRLDVLDGVGQAAEDYFAALPPREINDHALEKQAMALRQIGELRLQQGQHQAAQRAFETSLAQLGELSARKPSDPAVLFERAQAEFWAGAAHYRALAPDTARDYFQRYADSAARLVTLAPDNPDYRMEQAYALSNLGTLAIDQRDLDGAEEAFARSGEIFQELAAKASDDPQLRFEAAANESWRARIQEARFAWPAAAEHRRSAARQHAEASRASGHPFHRRIEAEAWVALSRAEFAVGRVEEALTAEAAATALYEALAGQDPDNVEWRMGLLRSRARRAALAPFGGAIDDAGSIESGQRAFEAMLATSAADPDNALWQEMTAVAGLELASRLLLDQSAERAAEMLGQIGPIVRSVHERAPDDTLTARTFLTYAALAALAGRDPGALSEARQRLAAEPGLAQAHRHLAALLAELDGDRAEAGRLASEMAAAGFASPRYAALQALAHR